MAEKLEALRKAVGHYGLMMTAHADEEAREENILLQDIHEESQTERSSRIIQPIGGALAA